ncbi:MAG: tetratricopeptide repeat protein, partial [Anaerolineae bacterium]
MPASLPDSSLATLEKLQGQLPPHLARSDLAELAVLLRYAEGGCWAFALYNTVPVRDEVAAVLRDLLAPLPVYNVTLSPQGPDPLTYLKDLPPDPQRAIVFFFDLEQTGGAAWDYLETQREYFTTRPLGLVFWIDRRARGEGLRRAPNFWSQRSGVFDFTIESEAVLSEVRGAWAGQPVRLDGLDDWERQMRLFRGLLREYQAEDAPPAARAELHGKIAYLLHFADRHEEAAEHLQHQLKLGREAGDQRQQVEALNNLGRVAQIRQGRLAALTWYEQALDAAGDEPRGRAESLQNLAVALAWEGEANRAQEMLAQALALFRA